MKAVWSWLLELCDLSKTPTVEEGAAALTGAGIEIEGMTDLASTFSGVVIAEVIAKRPHPNADKLTLVDVITSRDGTHTQVVCGAPNVPAPGKRVLWARPGATLPNGMTLGVKPVKGVDSPGMLCSETELACGDSDEGIIVIDEGEPGALGAPAQEALGLADWVLEVNIPANRGDALSHLGLARELAALLGGRAVAPAPVLDDLFTELDPAIELDLRDGCPRYVARVIDGVSVRRSPRRIAARLRAVGVRPISNLVDVTNYVMFELGHPLHAFDAATVQGPAVGVRRAGADASFTTLDGTARALVPDDLVIFDRRGAIALAGVMGGLDTEVTDGTSRVLLESASFDPRAIRRTARRLGLHSEASSRFERGVDPATCELASARASELLARHGGGKVARTAVDAYPMPRAAVTVSMRVARARALTGVDLDTATCRGALERLGMTITGDEVLEAEVPTWRADLTREVDLIEEILRMVGFGGVPATLPALRAAPVRTVDDRPDRARRALAATGVSEAITYGFQNPARVAALGLAAGDRRATPIALRNPMSVDQGVMRTSLLPNLLAAVARNRNNGVPDVALFEVGSVFLSNGSRGLRPQEAVDLIEARSRQGELPDEPVHACVVLAGNRPHALGAGEPWDAFDARGIAEALFAALTAHRPKFVPAQDVPYLHPGVAARIFLGDYACGEVGEVHPDVRLALGVDVPVFMVDVALSALGNPPVRQMRAIPKYPATARDVSLLLAEEVPAARVGDVIAAAAQPLVEAVRVVEDYRGAQLPAGHKSMLWSITYRATDRTLTDAEVEAAHEAIVARLVAELPAQRR